MNKDSLPFAAALAVLVLSSAANAGYVYKTTIGKSSPFLNGSAVDMVANADGSVVVASADALFLLDRNGQPLKASYTDHATPCATEAALSVISHVSAAVGGDYLVSGESCDGTAKLFLLDRNLQLKASFGNPGTNAGQIGSVGGIAVTPDGRIVVSDELNHRINRYNYDGSFIASFGSYGSTNNYLNTPGAVVVGPGGDIYVADRNNARVQRFDSNGVYKATIGATSVTKPIDVRDLAVDSNNVLYVLDNEGKPVKAYDNNNKYLQSFGAFGVDDDSIDIATTIAVNGYNVFVYDMLGYAQGYGRQRLHRFDKQGAYDMNMLPVQSDNGNFAWPYYIASNTSDEIIVADRGNDRVQVFDRNGNFLRIIGAQKSTIPNNRFLQVNSIAAMSNGQLVVSDGANRSITVLNTDGSAAARLTSYGRSSGQIRAPGVVTTNGNQFAVLDNENRRVTVYNSTGSVLRSIGGYGVINSRFLQPVDIALAPNGNILVADTGKKRVSEFSSAGVFVRSYGATSDLSNMKHIVVTATGLLVVVQQAADGSSATLREFNSDGTDTGIKLTLTTSGGDPDQFIELIRYGNNLLGYTSDGIVQIDSAYTITGRYQLSSPLGYETITAVGTSLSVARSDSPEIIRFNMGTGFDTPLTETDRIGGLPVGYLYDPQGIAVGKDDRIAIGSTTASVNVFSGSGNHLFRIGHSEYHVGSEAGGQFYFPRSVAFNASNELIVGDSNAQLQYFDYNGNYLRFFDIFHAGANPAPTTSARDLSIDAAGAIWRSGTGSRPGRLAKLSGSTLQAFNSPESTNGLYGITALKNGKLAAAVAFHSDALNGIYFFDSNGLFLNSWRPAGVGAGQLFNPYDIAELSDGTLAITDNLTNRVQIYQLDSDDDGYGDSEDAFPNNATEWADFDKDGVGDNGDTDDDNDGIPDDYEAANGLDSHNYDDALADADGDGISNIVEYRLGSDPQNSASVPATMRKVRGDMDGDLIADLVWRNTLTGKNQMWRLDGVRLLKKINLPTVADTSWQIIAQADVDGDGKTDLVWQHMESGAIYVWLMDGARRSSYGSLGTTTLNWQLAGSGDVDGDGKSDLIWRDNVTGQVNIWLMNGLTIISQSSPATVADLAQQIVGVNDLNGDRKADIVWRNSATGSNAVWLMNGAVIASNTALPAQVGSDWQFIAAEDMSGDDKVDLIWRSASTGVNQIWFMDGATRTSSANSSVAMPGSDWVLVRAANFTNDKYSDWVWRRSSNGQNQMWTMKSAKRLSAAFLPSITDLNWTLISR